MNINEYSSLKSTINDMINSLLDKYKQVHPNVVIEDVNVTVSNNSFLLEPRSDSLYYVENGRRPGKFPPVDVLREWAEKRVSLPRDIESLAYLAGRRVSLHGTDGDGAWAEMAEKTLAEWKTRLEKALEDDFINIELNNIISIKR